jgi:hypothetical protein
MRNDSLSLDGPDFLDAVATAELEHGNEINAATYRDRCNEWRRDKRLIESLEAQVAQLSAVRAVAPASLPAHALTPTDCRR